MILGLVLTVPRLDAEVAADDLWSLGVVAVEERRPLTDAAEGPDLVELWTSLGEDGEDLAAAVAHLSIRWSCRLVEVDEDVANTWRATARPTWVADDLVVVPAWTAFEAPTGVTALFIEPGATFGLGDHPTTQLTMRGLRAALSAGDEVLDVGCGSGVLAVAACRFGAGRAVAIDISPASVPTTLLNAATNGVDESVSVSTTPLAEVEGRYDIVLANILAPALVALADDLRRVLAPTGTLVISGILADHHQHVLDALAPLRVTSGVEMDGWAAVSLRW